MKFDGTVPLRYSRVLAVGLFVVAMALPWGAAHQGWVRFDARAATPGVSKPIRFHPDMVELPGGTFLMGSPASEADRQPDETQHSVTVAPFAMFRTEVTLAQWQAVMGNRPNDCKYGCDDNHPVHNVTMYDALRYANRLTDKENDLIDADKPKLTRCYDETNWSWDRTCTGYRLPTEAEWEYAARAGTTTAYSFGDQAKDLCAYGNGADLEATRIHTDWTVNEACNDGQANLAPVGNYKPNPWGLYDMHGNVWERVWDKYTTYSDKPLPNDHGSDVDSVGDKDDRVLRGGSFSFASQKLRSATRGGAQPNNSSGVDGFRCVRVVPAQR